MPGTTVPRGGRVCLYGSCDPARSAGAPKNCWRTVVLTRKSILAAIAATIAIGAVPSAAQAQDKSITVFAAASMKNALDDVDAAFTKQSGIKVVASYDASSALMKQIEGGA